MLKERKIWLAALFAAWFVGGVGDASADRFVHVESDDLHDTTAGTIEPNWNGTSSGGEDDPDYTCGSNSQSTSNSGVGNNCSWCISEDGSSLESCKCDGNNKNHDDCVMSMESGSGEYEVYSGEYAELIYQVLKANGLEIPADLGPTPSSFADIAVFPGRRLKRQTWERKDFE